MQQNCHLDRTRIGAGCVKDGLKPGYGPYPSRGRSVVSRVAVDRVPSVSVHQLGVDVATLWLRHGCPWSIGCGDPRSQKRDPTARRGRLGHPSRFSDTVRSGDHVRAEAQFPFSSLPFPVLGNDFSAACSAVPFVRGRIVMNRPLDSLYKPCTNCSCRQCWL
jgi:hypothetical protein